MAHVYDLIRDQHTFSVDVEQPVAEVAKAMGALRERRATGKVVLTTGRG